MSDKTLQGPAHHWSFEQEVKQRLNAIDYAVAKIQHDHVQILIWISNTRKRMLEQEMFNDAGDYRDSEPKPFRDGCPRITLAKKKTKGRG